MYCNKCGNQVEENDLFCSKCGIILKKENQELPVVESIEVCEKCNEEKRNIIRNGKETGETICLNCANSPHGSCPFCGKELRTAQAQQCQYCNSSWHKKSIPIEFSITRSKSTPVRCPRCSSQNIAANQKGFGLGNAVVGGVLLGGLGLLGGFVGSGKIQITCLKCGKKWYPK